MQGPSRSQQPSGKAARCSGADNIPDVNPKPVQILNFKIFKPSTQLSNLSGRCAFLWPEVSRCILESGFHIAHHDQSCTFGDAAHCV